MLLGDAYEDEADDDYQYLDDDDDDDEKYAAAASVVSKECYQQNFEMGKTVRLQSFSLLHDSSFWMSVKLLALTIGQSVDHWPYMPIARTAIAIILCLECLKCMELRKKLEKHFHSSKTIQSKCKLAEL